MAKSIGAVAAALVAMLAAVMVGSLAAAALLAGADGAVTASYLTANLLVSFGAAYGGGWLAAHLAARRPLAHAVALAGVLLLLSLPGLFSAPAPGQPTWYPMVLPVIGVVGVLSGGMMRQRRRTVGADAVTPGQAVA